MAKQLGLHKVQGKVGEYSYYESKNGGSVMRSINQGMSERVKSSKEYANTRLNNAEFGGSGSCAGAIVRGITSRWRFILSPKATGLLAKDIKASMLMDITNPWGERILRAEEAPTIQERFNMLSKNQVPDFIKNYVKNHIMIDAEEGKVFSDDTLNTTADFEQELKARGADGFAINVYCYAVTSPKVDTAENKYAPSTSQMQLLDNFSSSIAITGAGGISIFSDDAEATSIEPKNSDIQIGGLLVVLLPYKTVGGIKYTLQELCSAYWAALANGILPEP